MSSKQRDLPYIPPSLPACYIRYIYIYLYMYLGLKAENRRKETHREVGVAFINDICMNLKLDCNGMATWSGE